MPGEDDKNRDYYGERPPPTIDPTKITVEAIATSQDHLTNLFEAKLSALRDLMDEKLAAISTQITERDSRRDQEKTDANEKVAAALQAQKEAVGKTEASFGEQIKAVTTNLTTLADGIRREISDLKEYRNLTTGKGEGSHAVWSVVLATSSLIGALMGGFISLLFHH